MQPVRIAAYTLTCAAGRGMEEVRESLTSRRTGLSAEPWPGSNIESLFGKVASLDDDGISIDPAYLSRNNQLAALGLSNDGFIDAVRNVKDQYGADKCGVIIGTSTSSIGRTEAAYTHLTDTGEFAPDFNQPLVHNPHSTTAFTTAYLGTTGPNMTISTACSSSAKTFASASRWLESGIADAVIVGGIDSLCLSVIHGFHSLQLVSAAPCQPFDKQRSGINLGEAAGYALLTRADHSTASISLLGYGESCDAYHMSSAHPEGLGARLAMDNAIRRSGLAYDRIDYINMHGTGTRSNDDIEARICAKLFPEWVPASSTKGWTGHTLGAAGITESIIAMDSLQTGVLPGTLNTSDPEPAFASNLLLENRQTEVHYVMSNSFGFGGNNCSLIFGRARS
jgi:3-oxoacyl-[acyl-carrier-protein] synthase-1